MQTLSLIYKAVLSWKHNNEFLHGDNLFSSTVQHMLLPYEYA